MTTAVANLQDVLQLVSFRLGTEEFCIDIAMVQEIVRMPNITKVPRAPEFLEGVVNLRGKIVPVIDLRKRFHLPARQESRSTRIIIVSIESRTVGIVVDGVSEVLRIATDSIDATPDMVASTVDATFLKGIAKLEGRLLLLLDLTHVVQQSELASLALVA